MNWREKYTAYERKGFDSFAGDWTQIVVINNESGLVIGHLWGWANPSVQHHWNPKRDRFAGKLWRKVRPKGWRKVREQTRVLDWAIEAIAEWAS